ncbi:MAG: ABC transporter [Chloroflexi bacterium RBG_16_58_14]|nr:MAG: ABC transporter [Chloroflexi bacterium RBG_16_58_14]
MPRAALISVQQLSKHFKVPVRQAGLKNALVSLVNRKFNTVKAVDEISFQIGSGEVVGFLGPNGAGKTTTLKMLTGLLYPTSGSVKVLGYEPSRRRKNYLSLITLVMGNRNQLAWDLPALDSFDLQRAIYGIPETQFRRTRDEFIEMLELKDLVTKPVRNLSLGERMKMEIVAALLHTPRILFLDEPTIGLDVTMQRRIRTFIAGYNRKYHATVLLTSHYMADVEALCRRVIVIHHGKLLFDGALSQLVDSFSAYKTLGATLTNGSGDLSRYGQIMSQDGARVSLRVPRADVSRLTAQLLAEQQVDDLTVEDPPIEEVIEQVFAQGAPQESPA